MSIIEKALDKLVKPNNGHDTGPDGSKDDSYNTNINSSTEQMPDIESQLNIDELSGNDGRGGGASKSINIDLHELDLMGFISPETKNIRLFEQFRNIKMQLLSNVFVKKSHGMRNSNIIVMTSAISGEGKTFSSINLALSIAYEYNNTVLYVDGDITKKTASKLLGLENYPGLTDYLLNVKPVLSDLLLSTNLAKFSILPAGGFHERATELYASKRMQDLINELSQRYNDRIIIIDSPPLLQDTSATALSRLADQTVIVVEAEKTPRHIVEEAIRSLKTDKYIGVLFNKSNQRYGANYSYYSH